VSGWVTLQRGWRDNDVFADEPFTERDAWVWLIERAAWKDCVRTNAKGERVKIARGQYHTSLRNLESAWGWGKNKVARFLARLVDHEMIGTVAGQSGCLITICNYAKYQDMRDGRDGETGTVAGQSRDTQEQGKQGKQDKDKEREARERELPDDWEPTGTANSRTAPRIAGGRSCGSRAGRAGDVRRTAEPRDGDPCLCPCTRHGADDALRQADGRQDTPSPVSGHGGAFPLLSVPWPSEWNLILQIPERIRLRLRFMRIPAIINPAGHELDFTGANVVLSLALIFADRQFTLHNDLDALAQIFTQRPGTLSPDRYAARGRDLLDCARCFYDVGMCLHGEHNA